MTIICDAIAFGMCGDKRCRNVHFQMAVQDGEVIASAAVPLELIPKIISDLQNCAYEVATLKEKE